MESLFVSIMTHRSMPMPRPPVGGRPYSRAVMIVLVHHAGLVVALVPQLHLRLEALALVDGIVELGEGVAHLTVADEQLEPLGEAGVLRGAAWPGGRRPPDAW